MSKWSDDEQRLKMLLDSGATVVANMRKGAHSNLIAYAKSKGLFERIDRQTKWGNPYAIGRGGDRDEVCDRFASERLHQIVRFIPELKGKVLGCWCKPMRCHGDTIADLANELQKAKR